MTASPLGLLSAVWGLVGVTALLGSAVYRLTPWATELFADGVSLGWYHWLALGLNVVFMGYSEGYKGFQRGFSPRVAARARYLSTHPNLVRSLAAPLFCMGFFGATRRRLITSYVLTAGIVCLIVLVRMLDQPWRGIVDAGVVVGLGWGLLALWFYAARALTSAHFDVSPEVPAERVREH